MDILADVLPFSNSIDDLRISALFVTAAAQGLYRQ
jgi:hypothetical protein